MVPPNALLQTKLFVPHARSTSIKRPRLTARLNEALALNRQIILVSATAGFGKTTLLSEWRTNAPNAAQFCWLALDESDNDPVRFWTYFVAALQTVSPNVGAATLALLQTAGHTDGRALVTPLLNDLLGLEHLTVLVLDDYHNISAQSVQETLAYLLDNLPPNLFIVFNTRSDPLLPLGRYRARGSLLEVRASDLRFTPGESAQFLNQTMSLDLTADQVAALEARTEGWIAGLHLAALAIQSTGNASNARAASDFIGSFTGSHRYVMDYLVDEVLRRQTPAAQEFLMRTSILERFNVSLCNAITQSNDAGTHLEYLERANMFLVPLDDKNEWFRYHHLFAELLQHRLHQVEPALDSVLHTRAGDWFEAHGFPGQAIEHALMARAYDSAAERIAQQYSAMLKRGQIKMLSGWLDALPRETVEREPRLVTARALTRLAVNDLDQAERDLVRAGQLLDEITPETEWVRRVRGEIAASHSSISFYARDLTAANKWIQCALDDLPPGDSGTRGEVMFWRGAVAMSENRLQVALESYREAHRLAELAGDNINSLRSLVNVGAHEFAFGNLHAAHREYTRGVELMRSRNLSNLAVASVLQTNLSGLLYQWNNLAEATELAQTALRAAQRHDDPRMIVQCLPVLAQALYAAGEKAEAFTHLDRALALVRRRNVPFHYAAPTHLLLVRLWCTEGKLAAALEWQRENETVLRSGTFDHTHLMYYLANTRILQLRSESSRADEYLLPYLTFTRQTDNVFLEIHFLVQLALHFHAENDLSAAVASLERALYLAEPGQFLRVFLDEGAPMQTLLTSVRRQLASLSARQMFASIDRILAAFPPTITPVEQSQRSTHISGLNTLTPRELQVLTLIAAGKSNQEIADDLVVTLSAIKKHTNLIFSKLNVNNRTQAVARARELGIL